MPTPLPIGRGKGAFAAPSVIWKCTVHCIHCNRPVHQWPVSVSLRLANMTGEQLYHITCLITSVESPYSFQIPRGTSSGLSGSDVNLLIKKYFGLKILLEIHCFINKPDCHNSKLNDKRHQTLRMKHKSCSLR